MIARGRREQVLYVRSQVQTDRVVIVSSMSRLILLAFLAWPTQSVAGQIVVEAEPNPATAEDRIEIIATAVIFQPFDALDFSVSVDGRIITAQLSMGDVPVVGLVGLFIERIGPLEPGVYTVESRLLRGGVLEESSRSTLIVEGARPVNVMSNRYTVTLLIALVVGIAYGVRRRRPI